MATVLHSFEELARHFGVKVSDVDLSAGMMARVLAKCGPKAQRIWAILQFRESCKRYGPKGNIYLTPDDLQALTGYETGTILGCCLALARNGLARFSTDGKYVKAA